MANTWFTFAEDGEEARIEFHSSDIRFWPPEIMMIQPMSSVIGRYRSLTLTGSGAVWMYAHAAAMAASAGVQDLQVKTLRSTEESVRQSPPEVSISINPSEDDYSAVLIIELPYTGADLSEGRERIIEQLDHCPAAVRRLCITGRASVACYSVAAFEAVRRGISELFCLTPVDALVCVFHSDCSKIGRWREPIPNWLKQWVADRPLGRIIGIIGDPNSGKSVFSFVLELFRQLKQISGWRCDCDGQSPTSDWYLDFIRGDPATADKIRREQKVSWSEKMEDEIAARLTRAQHYLSLVIADLPGGDHRTIPAKRIPEHRETIFRPVDRFVLLQRADRPTEEQWEAELSRNGMGGRIVLVVNSSLPKNPPTLKIKYSRGRPWRVDATGLDRATAVADFIESLDRPMNAILKYLCE